MGAIVAAHGVLLGLLVVLKGAPPALPVSALTVQIIAPEPLAVSAARSSRPMPAEVKPPRRPQAKPVTQRAERSMPPVATSVLAARADTAVALSASESESRVTAGESEAPASAAAAPATMPSASAAESAVAARFDADYLLNPPPVYPPLARRLGEEGKVVLRVFVEGNGRPSKIEIRSGSGFSRLDQAARDAVARWKFIPARRGDETVAAWVLVPLVFNLKN